MEVSIDITGNGRLRCYQCNTISPSYYPNCPKCGSTSFTSLEPEPEPFFELETEFFQAFKFDRETEIMKTIYVTKAEELVNNFERKGFLLHGDRRIEISFQYGFQFSLPALNIELARGAIGGRFFNNIQSFSVFPVRQDFVIRISSASAAHVLASYGEFNPPLPRPSETIFYPSNRPSDDVLLLYCSVCHYGNHDPNDLDPKRDNVCEQKSDPVSEQKSDDEGTISDSDMDVDDTQVDDMDEEDDDEDEEDEEDDDEDEEDEEEGDAMGAEGVADLDHKDHRSYRLLIPCGHMFHQFCIEEAVRRCNTLRCPFCRTIMLSENKDFNAWAAIHID